MLHIYCNTPVAVFLCGLRDTTGVLRFPPVEGDVPGLSFETRPRTPINEQLIDQLKETLARETGASAENLELDINQEYSDTVDLPDGRQGTLYVAIGSGVEGPESWPRLPDLLRAMPADRSRVPYLRAWQVLTGGLKLNTKALETEDIEKLAGSLFES